MDKIIIACDSTVDLSKEIIERYNIKVLPLTVSLGDKDYKDGVDLFPQMIYDYHAKTGELPKTSAINVTQYVDFFNEINEENSQIIFISFSSKMSSTYMNAKIAKESFDNVHIVDSANLSTGGGLVVITAASLANSGKSCEEILNEFERISPWVDASFVIDILE